MRTPLTLSMIFTGGQFAFIIILAVLVLCAVGVNVWFGFKWRIKSERAMHNAELRNRREALLSKIEYLNSGGDAAPQSWIDFAMYGDEDDENDEAAATEQVADGVQPPNTVELAVGEMSSRARTKIGLKSKVFDNKRYYVRYQLGFDAKLRFSDDETKSYYTQIINDVTAYNGVAVEDDFNCKRIYAGKELMAKMNFMGKRLAVSLALDPKKYEGGKFDIEDKSDKKSFAKTPLLVRIKSADNVDDVRQLFTFAATENSAEKGERKDNKFDLVERTRDDLIARGSVRVSLMGEVV